VTEQERIKAIYDRTKSECHRMVTEYGASKDVLEVRHLEKIDDILDAPTPKVALELSERATTSVHTTLLSLLARGRILGRNPKAMLEKKARKAESRVRMYEKQAESKFNTAEEQAKFRKKAEKEKAKALELWKQAGIEPPQELVLSSDELAEAEQEVVKAQAATKAVKAKRSGKRGRVA
jgi:hypothetical protein